MIGVPRVTARRPCARSQVAAVWGQPLPANSRNQVLHVVTDRADSVILKRYLVPKAFAAAREPSALTALGSVSSGCAPRVIAEEADLPESPPDLTSGTPQRESATGGRARGSDSDGESR